MPSDRTFRADPWLEDADDAGEPPPRRLTRDEVQALVANSPQTVSPWRVVAAQAGVGVLVALLAGAISARWSGFWSALYGAGAVVLPSALMAFGMLRGRTGMAPSALVVRFMVWELVKIGLTVAMLAASIHVVQPLVWPALLVGLVFALKAYWVALLWRRRSKS